MRFRKESRPISCCINSVPALTGLTFSSTLTCAQKDTGRISPVNTLSVVPDVGFDLDQVFMSAPINLIRTAVYSLAFFLFRTIAAELSASLRLLQRSAVDGIRLCPLEPDDRPIGCP